MNARELNRIIGVLIHKAFLDDKEIDSVVYIDEQTGAEVEIVDAILERGKIKLITKFTKDESGA